MHKKHLTFIGTNNLLADLFRNRDYFVEQYGRNTKVKIDFTDEDIDKQIEFLLKQSKSDIFILLSGHLQSSDLIKQTQENRINSFLINSIGPVLFSEYILKKKTNARIIIIGSESGMKGSYDLTYALAKSSLRMYVRQKSIGINQQLLLLSPSIKSKPFSLPPLHAYRVLLTISKPCGPEPTLLTNKVSATPSHFNICPFEELEI